MWFGSRTRVLSHMQDKNPICRANALLREAFLSSDEVSGLCTTDAASRLDNLHQSLQKHHASRLCVRTFGPHRVTFSLEGEIVESDKNGPIMRGGKKHLPVLLVHGSYEFL